MSLLISTTMKTSVLLLNKSPHMQLQHKDQSCQCTTSTHRDYYGKHQGHGQGRRKRRRMQDYVAMFQFLRLS